MGIDINAEDFLSSFDISKATVGQVGYGFIGNAAVELFRPHVKGVMVYDKAMAESGYNRHRPENVFFGNDIELVVGTAEVIFIAVPTPMKPSGECHTGIVESVLQDIQNSAIKLGRSLNDFIVVLKSTVPPGFTKRMQEKYALRLLFSPEFLTEANAVEDFKNATRVLLGGDVEDAQTVYAYFAGVWPDRVQDRRTLILRSDSDVAEMVKLSTNVHLTAKVMISNELYLICQKLGINYDTVKTLTQLDPRIGMSHMNVPGPDGHLGYGGHCFVKDTQNLAFISDQLGISVDEIDGFKNNLFRNLHLRNLQIRDDRDWEAQKGRAVIDE